MMLAFAEGLGGVAAVDRPRGEVAGGDGAEAEDGTFAYVDAGADGGAGTDPGVLAEGHLVGEQREAGVVVVVGCAAEVAVLREDYVRGEVHGRGVVDFDAIASGDVVGAEEVPRGPDFGGGVEVAVGAERGSKGAQEEAAPAVHGAW